MWLEKVWNPCPRELVKKHEVLLPWQRFLKVVACRKFKPRAKNIPAVESLACQHTHVWTWHTRNTRVCERDTPGTSTWRQTRAKASQTAQSKMFENVKIADKKENGSDQLHRHIGVRGGKCKRVYRRHTYQHTNISATRVSTHEYIGDTPQHTETTDTIPATGDLLARHKRYQQHNCKNVEEIYGRGGGIWTGGGRNNTSHVMASNTGFRRNVLSSYCRKTRTFIQQSYQNSNRQRSVDVNKQWTMWPWGWRHRTHPLGRDGNIPAWKKWNRVTCSFADVDFGKLTSAGVVLKQSCQDNPWMHRCWTEVMARENVRSEEKTWIWTGFSALSFDLLISKMLSFIKNG